MLGYQVMIKKEGTRILHHVCYTRFETAPPVYLYDNGKKNGNRNTRLNPSRIMINEKLAPKLIANGDNFKNSGKYLGFFLAHYCIIFH